MKQLNWYQIFGKSNIPDGRTVLPTDDIQIWLNCANIWDKTYTTLAEVLADTDTLLALISSNNAVDYMVRSTTWASYICVPTMTDNTHPSGTVFASGHYSSYYPWKAFDGNDSTDWEVAGNTNKYIGYRFTEAVSVWKCKVVNLGSSDNVPKDCYIEYSDDNVTWTKVDGSDFVNSGVAGATTEVIIAESGKHEYWRLYVSNTQGGGNYVYVATLQFYSASITADATAMTYIGQNNYCANTLLADSAWCNAICNSEYFESVLNVKVPVMTSNTTPSGEVITSGAHSNGPAYYAFDGNNSTMYQSSTYDVSHYVGYVYPDSIKCAKIVATIQNGAASAQTMQGKIQVSSDGVTWNDIGTWSFASVPWSEDRNISFAASDFSTLNYRYFRFLRTAGADRFRVRNAQFYGREDV